MFRSVETTAQMVSFVLRYCFIWFSWIKTLICFRHRFPFSFHSSSGQFSISFCSRKSKQFGLLLRTVLPPDTITERKTGKNIENNFFVSTSTIRLRTLRVRKGRNKINRNTNHTLEYCSCAMYKIYLYPSIVFFGHNVYMGYKVSWYHVLSILKIAKLLDAFRLES